MKKYHYYFFILSLIIVQNVHSMLNSSHQDQITSDIASLKTINPYYIAVFAGSLATGFCGYKAWDFKLRKKIEKKKLIEKNKLNKKTVNELNENLNKFNKVSEFITIIDEKTRKLNSNEVDDLNAVIESVVGIILNINLEAISQQETISRFKSNFQSNHLSTENYKSFFYFNQDGTPKDKQVFNILWSDFKLILRKHRNDIQNYTQKDIQNDAIVICNKNFIFWKNVTIFLALSTTGLLGYKMFIAKN